MIMNPSRIVLHKEKECDMLYLTNQELPFIEMARISPMRATEIIENAHIDESIISALDSETANMLKAGLELKIDIPELDREEFGPDATPDDVAITIEDNLELGDEVLAIDHRGTYYYFMQTEG